MRVTLKGFVLLTNPHSHARAKVSSDGSFVFSFAIYLRRTISYLFSCCILEATSFSGAKYEQIMVTKQVVRKL